MTHEFSDLDVVRAVLANIQRFPDGTPVDWDGAGREAAAQRLFTRVNHIFPGSTLVFDDQDRSGYARIILPQTTSLESWLSASIILSQVDSFVTIAYAPEMLPRLECALLDVFEEEELCYISFSNFCPDPPPQENVEACNSYQMANEELWRALFDYY